MDAAMEDGKGQRQQRWHLMAAAVGGNGGRQCLTAAINEGKAVVVIDEDKTAKGSGSKAGV